MVSNVESLHSSKKSKILDSCDKVYDFTYEAVINKH
jgi:hypothetical protein